MSDIFDLKDPSLLKDVAYVDGKWVKAASGATFGIDNPATGKVVAQAADFEPVDVEKAIAAAKKAFPSYRKTSPRTRAKYLRNWYNLMIENKDDLARIVTIENGKPLAEARGEIGYASAFVEWYAEEAPRIYGDVIQASDPKNRIYTRKEPVGVCALLVPWNFPSAMITRKLAPALAAGCTAVVKAPAETPLSAFALAELVERAGFPPGVLNIITCSNDNVAEVGKTLTTHPDVKKVSFTGSTAVGKLLMSQASSSLKKLSLELGGNAPFIVFDDADLDAAVRGLIECKFRNSGQTCVSANRIYVQRGVYEKFLQMLKVAMEKLVVGHGLEEGTTNGPLIHQRSLEKVERHVKDALDKGARLLVGGKRLPDLGPTFYSVTLLADMKPEMAVSCEETFGPVASVYPFDTEEEAIQRANENSMGLGGYFYSRDSARCWRVAEAMEVGIVGVNAPTAGDPAAPFGGVKESGFGREGGKFGIEEYLTVKMILHCMGDKA